MSSRRHVIGQVLVEHRAELDTRGPRGIREYRYEAPEAVDVYAIYPRTSTEPDVHGRQPVVSGMTVLAHINAKGRVTAYDRVTLPDGTVWQVNGRPGVWEKNPHSRTRYNECVQIELELKEG